MLGDTIDCKPVMINQPTIRLGKSSIQVICPKCHMRIMTVVVPRMCHLMPPRHQCPQCANVISKDSLINNTSQ
ncbi:unnamed protein product [Auanema sp. JU1783]|nr:unnamed protein product [Auanema sp. JU1783]